MVNIGATVSYRLREDQRPINPRRVWSGEIVYVSKGTEPPFIIVKILDDGYEGLTEEVYYNQIVQFRLDIERRTEPIAAIVMEHLR